MSDTPHATQVDAILDALLHGRTLPSGTAVPGLAPTIKVEELNSREHLTIKTRIPPFVFLLYDGQEFNRANVVGSRERQNSQWEFGLFVGAKGRANAVPGEDLYSLLRSTFQLLRGLPTGEPGANLECLDERFFDAIPGAVIYLQRWTTWRQEPQ